MVKTPLEAPPPCGIRPVHGPSQAPYPSQVSIALRGTLQPVMEHREVGQETGRGDRNNASRGLLHAVDIRMHRGGKEQHLWYLVRQRGLPLTCIEVPAASAAQNPHVPSPSCSPRYTAKGIVMPHHPTRFMQAPNFCLPQPRSTPPKAALRPGNFKI